jgi:heme exporter protein C
MRSGTFYVFLLLALGGLGLAPFLIVGAPMEETMGLVQRIFYYHVPVAWLTFLSVFVCAAGSAAWLFKKSQRGDEIAVAAAELTLVFGICMLVTGPLWARKAWGVWWVWKDVRLMTALLLWFIFGAYVFVRRFGGAGSTKLAAGLALFAAADVPIIYASVFFWRTQHPKATVVSTLDPRMRPAFYLSLATFTLLWVVLMAMRLRVERLRSKLEEAQLAADDAGLLDEANA